MGCGGREVAIATAITRSSIKHELYCVGNYYNPQLSDMCVGYLRVDSLCGDKGRVVRQNKFQDMLQEFNPDICIIGPEDLLTEGWGDYLKSMGIKCIGPPSYIAKLESDKAWCRRFLFKYGFEKYCPYFTEPGTINESRDIMEKLGGNYVIKPTGLYSGKGVKVSGDHLASIDDGVNYCRELGTNSYIIEEKLTGYEFSCMSLTDGRNCVHFPMAVDYKRAFDGDKGPNTGGMGCRVYTESPKWITSATYAEACCINERVVESLAFVYHGDSNFWAGIVFGGFMVTDDGKLKILEYNMRFGDPEAIAVLASLPQNIDILR